MRRDLKLAIVVGLSRRRLERRQRALADAARGCVEAARALAMAQCLEDRAREVWRTSEDDFRERPQCEQRQMLRTVSNDRLLLAVDARLSAERELRAAEEQRADARQALLREEARFEQLGKLLRGERQRLAERTLGREEDEWTPRARAA